MSHATPAAPRSRRAPSTGRRLDPLLAAAVVLPLLVAVVVLVIGEQDDPAPAATPPVASGLTSAALVCPPALAADGGRGGGDSGGDVLGMRVPDVPGGEVAVGAGDPELIPGDPVDVAGTAPVAVPRNGIRGASGAPVLLTASDDAAPGLVAGRRDADVAGSCREPGYDEWYLGLGASARNASTVTLVNPDPSQAVVDIELTGPRGPIEERNLRDITVPASGVVHLDLAEVAPRRVDLAAHVSVTRGRIAVSVAHRLDSLGAGAVTADRLPAQAEAGTEQLLLGVADPDAGVLYLANPGEDEVRTELRVVTGEATFAPEGAEDIVVPPLTLRRVPLDGLIDQRASEGMLGIALESSAPLLSSVRTRSADDGDLVAAGAAEPLDGPAAVVLPPGPGRLLLGGAGRTGVVHVTGYDEDGEVVLDDERVEVGADRAAELRLGADVAALTLTSRNTTVAAVVLVGSGAGTAVVPVTQARVSAEIPVVAPR